MAQGSCPEINRIAVLTSGGGAMRCIFQLAAVMGAFFLADFGLSLASAADAQTSATQQQTTAAANQQTQDQWRYTFHNSEWWYWLPAGRWVYWRNGCWNEYDRATYTPPSVGAVAAGSSVSRSASQTGNADDSYPYYGHADSGWQRRTSEPNNEVGPYYGHATPNDVLGSWRSRRSTRPAYGRAASAGE
jgi:hypothetical protein